MGVLDLIKEDESFEFISLKEAINLLATKTKSTTFGIATYLLNKNVHSVLHGYYRGIDYKIHISSYSNYDHSGWVGENYAFTWLCYIVENEKHLKKFRVSNTDKYNNGCEESFWKRDDFLNLECVKVLNLFETKEWNILFKKQEYIWDSGYLATQFADQSFFLNVNDDICYDDSFPIEGINYPAERWIDKPSSKTKEYPLFFKHKTFCPHEATCLMIGYDPIETQWDYQNTNWLLANPEYEKASSFIFSAVKTDFFEKCSRGEYFITSDNLKVLLTESGRYIDGFNNKEFANIDNEGLVENTQFEKKIASLELDVAIEQLKVKELSEEIEKLKAELLDKEQKIKELESLPQKDKTDLISLIFDETATDRYAPDLVAAIKLWEYVYIISPKDDSHSNKADKWLGNNTGYDTAKKQGSASKIREITTPFINWGNLRDKKYKIELDLSY